MKSTFYTLIFIKKRNQLLLGFKKRGFAERTWNGYGGKLEHNEDIFDGAIRELYEESNLQVNTEDLNYLGYVTYKDSQCDTERVVYIFTTEKVSGTLQETEEMRPQWFLDNELPYLDMLPDSKLWLYLVLSDSKLKAHFTYANGKIVHHNVQRLAEAPFPLRITNYRQDM